MGKAIFTVVCLLVGMFLGFLFGESVLPALLLLFLGSYIVPAVWSFFTGPRFDNRLNGRTN